MTRPFIIDCDTGTDDAIALMAAFGCPEINVRAITSVNGNVREEYTSANNLNLTEYLGIDVEVARGATLPFYPRGDYYGPTHGKTGLGDVVIPDAVKSSFSKDMAPEVIRRIAEESGCTLNDRRDQRNSGTYLAFVSCVYAFLGIITLVTVLNIVNSISMSVSARVKQYGAMRAVGMDGRQVRHMIAAEAFTYAVLGGITGCALGLPLHWVLYDFLIARRFPYAVWRLPAGPLALILCFVIAAALLAACAPSRRICRMPVAETINEL